MIETRGGRPPEEIGRKDGIKKLPQVSGSFSFFDLDRVAAKLLV